MEVSIKYKTLFIQKRDKELNLRYDAPILIDICICLSHNLDIGEAFRIDV